MGSIAPAAKRLLSDRSHSRLAASPDFPQRTSSAARTSLFSVPGSSHPSPPPLIVPIARAVVATTAKSQRMTDLLERTLRAVSALPIRFWRRKCACFRSWIGTLGSSRCEMQHEPQAQPRGGSGWLSTAAMRPAAS